MLLPKRLRWRAGRDGLTVQTSRPETAKLLAAPTMPSPCTPAMWPLLLVASLTTLHSCTSTASTENAPGTPQRHCTVIDVSNATTSLHAAQVQARAASAAGAPCVVVALGRRTFHLTQPLVLTNADSQTSFVGQGAEITAAVDVPPSAWRRQNASEDGGGDVVGSPAAPQPHGLSVNASLFVGDASWGSMVSGSTLAVLVRVAGVWRPLTIARWPNIPFGDGPEPPVNWTTVASVPNASCGDECRSFVWGDATDRPARWVVAAAEGRLHVHGFFRYLWRDSRVAITRIVPAQRLMSANVSINPYGTPGLHRCGNVYSCPFPPLSVPLPATFPPPRPPP